MLADLSDDRQLVPFGARELEWIRLARLQLDRSPILKKLLVKRFNFRLALGQLVYVANGINVSPPTQHLNQRNVQVGAEALNV